jgi:hypothetical protein
MTGRGSQPKSAERLQRSVHAHDQPARRCLVARKDRRHICRLGSRDVSRALPQPADQPIPEDRWASSSRSACRRDLLSSFILPIASLVAVHHRVQLAYQLLDRRNFGQDLDRFSIANVRSQADCRS